MSKTVKKKNNYVQFVDDKFYRVLTLLGQHYEAGKICYNSRMKSKLLMLKMYIKLIKQEDVKAQYKDIYDILNNVYRNNSVTSLQKALYAKSILRLIDRKK